MCLRPSWQKPELHPIHRKTRSDTPRIAYPRNAAGCFPAVALSGDPTPKGNIMLKYLVSAQNKFDALRDRVLENESGNAAEYGLIIALVAVVIIAGLGALAIALNGTFNHVASKLPQ